LLFLFRGGLLLRLLLGLLVLRSSLLPGGSFLLLRRGFFLGRFGFLGLRRRRLRRGLPGLGRRLFRPLLHLQLVADELDDGRFGGVAAARPDLDDAGVATGTL